jgi:hypothetical protein
MKRLTDEEIDQLEKDSTQKPIVTERLFADLRAYKKALEDIEQYSTKEDMHYAQRFIAMIQSSRAALGKE